MNRFRFSIAGLLIMTAIVAVSVNPVAVYFGWQYPRKVRRMMSLVDSLEDSVSYEDFISEMKLGEMQEYPPMGGGDLSELSGYWEFNHGYRVDVDFGPDECWFTQRFGRTATTIASASGVGHGEIAREKMPLKNKCKDSSDLEAPLAKARWRQLPPAFLSPTSLARLILPVNVIAKGEL